MLDKWFIEEIDNKLKQADRLVIIDEQRKADFLFYCLKKVKTDKIFTVSSEIEELKTKYDIEKKYLGEKVLVITYIPLEKLKFLREYAESGECLQIKYLHRYIQSKVQEKMNFDINLSAEEIIALGKLSIGKGKEYWKRIKTKGGAFTEEDILNFLAEPKKYFASSGMEVQKYFIEFMSGFTEYSLENKPPETIAKEIADAIFENLLYTKKSSFLNQIYKQWVDSKKYESVLQLYVKKYVLPSDLDIWTVPLNHPFKDIDREWFKEVIQRLNDRKWLEEKLPFIEGRAAQPITTMLGVDYWQDIFTLFDYNPEKLTQICNLNDTIEHYKSMFYKIDQSIRHLYAHFLSEKKILQPLQGYYRRILQLFLDKWFIYFQEQYQEGQSGLLKNIIKENKPPVAIILGDAISYEVAQEIVKGITAEYKIKDTVLCGNYPSITENNMSRIFTTSEVILKTRGEREQILLKELKQDIKFNNLDELSISSVQENYTVFYAADMDRISEKEGQNALKYYKKIIKNIQEKIECLFKCGYKKVFLISDHGFVLTGLLEEADKIGFEVPQGEKFERYCFSKKKIDNLPVHIIGFKKLYKEFEYIYFSTTLNPFKTSGPYGFSHGGITPQELLIPYLQIEKFSEDVNKLQIEIINKDELSSVVGDIYPVRLKAGINPGDIFSSERKIIIVMVKDKHEFSQSDIITLREEEEIIREFNFYAHDEFEIIVLDAQSKTRLDSGRVKRNITRDLGGLGEKE